MYLLVTRAASIDIGTNTLRMLIADISPAGVLTPLHCERIITRLGEGFHTDGTLSEPACRRSLKALDEFMHIIKAYRISRVHAVATSVVREAINGGEFCSSVARQTGIAVKVLSGYEEAHLTLAGVVTSVQAADLCLIVDIGGGSTELILSQNGIPLKTASIRLGVVHLSEQLLRSDPSSQPELLSLQSKISNLIEDAIAQDFSPAITALAASPARFIGTAGSVTTLAAIDQSLEQYDSRKITNYCLSREMITGLFDRLAAMKRSERTTVAGLEEGREDLIIPGAAILLHLMIRFGFEVITVSDGGLLEGILIDAYRPQPSH